MAWRGPQPIAMSRKISTVEVIAKWLSKVMVSSEV